MLGLAAEVAFWLFLSLLPLVAVAGLIAAKLTVGHDAAVGSWLGAVPPSTRALVRRELAQLAASSGRTVGPVGTLIFVWLASSGIHSLFDAFDAMTNRERSWTRKRVTALGSCVLLALGGAALALLMRGVVWTRALLDLADTPVPETIGAAARLAAGGVLVLAVVASLYAIGIPKPSWRGRVLPILPGAVLATLLQAVLAFGYSLVIRMTGDGSAYLAGLATIGVTMTVVYLAVLSILLGVAVNEWWRIWRRARRSVAPATAPTAPTARAA
ncbi:MAG: YihY/virulence factor BrkB family protein [Myxococcales bacterium]|nr:YihY/virulence factor BrkB family protein [Myxococcales bacterium]